MLVNACQQVLVVSVTEVIVCWTLTAAAVESWLRPHTRLVWLPAAIAASVLFGLYHFARSDPAVKSLDTLTLPLLQPRHR